VIKVSDTRAVQKVGKGTAAEKMHF